MLRSFLFLFAFTAALPVFAQNSCEFAGDNECDEARYGGQGYCDAGTDTADCVQVSAGLNDDSCAFAMDGECDEYRYNGTGACLDGSDVTDCSAELARRASDFLERARAIGLDDATITALGDDSCRWNNDGECDDAERGGGGACAPGTDATDCLAQVGGDPAPDRTDGDDSCIYANDTECDEARFGGGGYCADGTDATDCAGADDQRGALDTLLDLVPADVRAQLGDDTCEYAFDLECDDGDFGGTGACLEGTDATDCRALAMGGDNSCQFANDNECDEPIIGLGHCISGSDTNDCTAERAFMNRTDSCDTAFDGVCNEVDLGDGMCMGLSDTADCIGRSRPASMQNHFFGRDDRFLVDATQMPWRAIGSIDQACTGTLVGPALVLTAAHCLYAGGEFTVPEIFYAGQSRGETLGTAKVLSAFHDPAYEDGADFFEDGGGNGVDWGLIVLDRNLGDEIGYLEVHELNAGDLSQIGRSGLIVNQAGYSWDTGNNLSGNIGCRITAAFEDNSINHECDTAKGDSGSPFLFSIDGVWQVVAVDSHFFSPIDDKAPFSVANRAVDSRAFAAAVAEAR